MNVFLLFALLGFFPGCVLQQLRVHFVGRQLNVTNHRSSDEAVFDSQHVRVFVRIRHTDVGQFDVQILIDRMQSAANGQIVLQGIGNIRFYLSLILLNRPITLSSTTTSLPTKDLKNE